MAWHQSLTGLMLAAGLSAQKLGLVKGSWLPLHHLTPACLCLHQIAQGIMRAPRHGASEDVESIGTCLWEDLAQEKGTTCWMLHIAGTHRGSCAKGLAPAESPQLMRNQVES